MPAGTDAPTSASLPNENLVLTGFMGSGKSAVGRALAAVLGRDFIDTDAVIVERHGPIPELFAAKGEAAFRRIEAELADELAGQSGLVLSTGGGMLLAPEVADRLAETGRIFCLVASPATIVARVRADGIAGRPLLDVDDPEARIEALLAERADRYGSFEAVATDDRELTDIVAELVTRFVSAPPA